MDTATMEAEIAQHVAWWNGYPQTARLLLLHTVYPDEVATFVAHSNTLEGVPTLSPADTVTMVVRRLSQIHPPLNDLASRAALNTYTAHRLAHAFRSQRGTAGVPVDELLWQLPELLAVHRELMRDLHPRAGRLRTCNVQPADRAAPYPPFTTVPSTIMSLFDVFNDRTLRSFEKAEGRLGDSAGWTAGARADEGCGEEEYALDEDGAVREDDCQRLLSAPPLAPAAHDIDARIVGPVARLAAWLAAHLLEVHPFSDGNGRLARILVDTLLAAVHPLPVLLVPEGCSLQDARVRYLAALREVPPWDKQGSTGWALEPTALTDLVLGSLVASWRRLRGQSSGSGPFLGVLALSLRAPIAQRRERYAVLGHCARLPSPPTRKALEAEADALPLPSDSAAQPALASDMVVHAPTGRLEDGWLQLIWLP